MALPKIPANAVAALVVGLGLGTVEMPATQILIIHGPRAYKLAKVRCLEANETDCPVDHHNLYSVCYAETTCWRITMLITSTALPTIEAHMTASSPMISNRNRCAKCGIIEKSGKRSCCARGGAWFKKCGDAGDTKFDHSWIEGIEACTDSRSVKSPLQILLHSEILRPLDTQSQNDTHQRVGISSHDKTSNAGATIYIILIIWVMLA